MGSGVTFTLSSAYHVITVHPGIRKGETGRSLEMQVGVSGAPETYCVWYILEGLYSKYP